MTRSHWRFDVCLSLPYSVSCVFMFVFAATLLIISFVGYIIIFHIFWRGAGRGPRGGHYVCLSAYIFFCCPDFFGETKLLLLVFRRRVVGGWYFVTHLVCCAFAERV